MKIRNLDFGENPIFLSPMAGVADFAFRALARRHGADFSFTEMISCKGLIYDNEKTKDMLFTLPEEKVCGIQLFGGDENDFAKVVKMKELEKFDIIDINFGCPAPKIVKNAEGSALLAFPEKIHKIVAAVKANTSKIVTAKIRLGINAETFNAVEVAREIEAAGADAIFVHGRFQEQKYSGSVDYEAIALIKKSVSIPVIGNGDIVDAESWEKMLATGVDGVSLARASLGRPWVFDDIKKGKIQKPELFEVMKEHYQSLRLVYSEEFCAKYLRKHFLWYLKPFNEVALKAEVVKMTDTSLMLEKLEVFFQNLKKS